MREEFPNSPSIYVVTLVKNDADGLRRTLNSILAQNILFSEYEVLVIDGNSKDGSGELARSLLRINDRVLSQDPKGIYAAMNFALEQLDRAGIDENCSILFLNSGDTFATEDSLKLLKDSQELSLHSVGYSIMLDLHRKMNAITPQPKILNGSASLLSPMEFWIPHQAYIAKWKIFKEVGFFSTPFRIAGDVDWLYRACTIFGPPRILNNVVSIQLAGGISYQLGFTGYLERVRISKLFGFDSRLTNWKLGIKLACLETYFRVFNREFKRHSGFAHMTSDFVEAKKLYLGWSKLDSE